jgi:hypothetical protein
MQFRCIDRVAADEVEMHAAGDQRSGQTDGVRAVVTAGEQAHPRHGLRGASRNRASVGVGRACPVLHHGFHADRRPAASVCITASNTVDRLIALVA